ncbi:hypothetical protein LTR99_000133 [Exophiala xenobiotica]|uniref:Uncharacterized protein n=1 Tax=Vermiconidia calcicola TaxID=1690605 RepID=A0AAV9PY40_9PEZI|nr:hypothetical protein LTR96_009312 [Exophiala xenobiotica]KAK5530058.1 hypothetical protein LTR25_009303 [Vermiconidia calcicola]KAK5547378.1 hypothetical protein LTR23_002599 [Chaetothyriales sp. CCFEE 6169]KAK5307164.1 hypothetical protein LTR99_000133 [Exophiala xenobiotica]KAK5343931.1 hypothetical protein LTR98_001563 [Exophiala xenobiotica]
MSQTGGSYQLLSHPTQGEAVNLSDIDTSTSTSRGPRLPLDPTPPPPPSPSYGRPAHKPFFNVVDTIAVILSIVSLGVTIGAISPSLRYAAELQYTGQIIVLGFALGIMNQCLQRVTPHVFLLLETRFGSSTIQNYDGILRWSPLTDQFGLLWRLALTLLLILPLVLGIAYKRYTGIETTTLSGTITLASSAWSQYRYLAQSTEFKSASSTSIPRAATLPSATTLQSTSNSSVATALFKQTALGFDVTRRTCTVTWEITSNSMKLVSGDCDPEPLDSVHQYFQNCQMFFTAAYYLPLAGDCIADFSTSRVESHWRIPTYATITAALFWSKIAGMGGYLAMQVGGPIEMYWTSYLGPVADSDLWQYNNMIAEAEARDGTWKFNETYPLNHTLLKQVSTLKPEAGLYMVLVIQPILTLAAFLVGLTMYHTPISRGFGMVSTLAGIDKGSVDLLSGATFSGGLKVPTRLRIKVTGEELQNGGLSKVEYIVGDKGSHGKVRMRRRYD